MSKGRNLVLLFAVTVAGIVGVTATSNNSINNDGVNVSEIREQAYQEGFEDGKNSASSEKFLEGYREGRNVSTRELQKQFSKDLENGLNRLKQYKSFDPGREVGFTGSFSYAGVDWSFKNDIERCGKHSGPGIGGCADVEKHEIKLETGEPAKWIKTRCDHEMLHLYFPEYSHGEKYFDRKDSIYFTAKYVDFPVCQQVLSKLERVEERGGSVAR